MDFHEGANFPVGFVHMSPGREGPRRSPGGTASVSSQASGAKRRPQRCTAVSAVKDTLVATLSITSHASRQHGRDDHAPSFALWRKVKTPTRSSLRLPHEKKESEFASPFVFWFSVRVNLDVFEHGITSDTIGKTGKNPRTRSCCQPDPVRVSGCSAQTK